MRPLQRAIREMTLYSAVQWVVLLASLVSFPVLTRLLSVTEYGMLAVANATAALLIGLAKCGFSTAYLREHAAVAGGEAAPRRTLVATSFWLAIGAAVIVGGAYLVAALGLGFAPGHLPASLPPFIAALVLAAALRDLHYAYLRANARFMQVSAVTLALRLGAVGCGLLLCWQWPDRIVGYFMGVAGWELMLVAALWVGVARAGNLAPPSAASRQVARHLVAYGAPLVVFEVSALANEYVDRYLIAHFMGLGQVGVYSVGYNLATYITLGLVIPMWQVIFPIVTRLWEQEGRAPAQEFLARVLHVYVFAACAIGLLVVTSGEGILRLLATAKFAESGAVFLPVSLVLLAYGATWIFAAGFHLQRRTGRLATLMALTAGLNVAFNMLLIPRLGLQGAVAATLLSYGAMTAAVVVLSRRYLVVPMPVRTLILCVAAAAAAALCARLPSFADPLAGMFARGALGLAVYLAIVLPLDTRLRELARGALGRLRPASAR